MNHQTIFLPLFLLAGLFCPMRATAQQVRLHVTNPTSSQRQEVVEADLQAICQSLGLKTSEALIVRNALGQQIACQTSHDGKLLIDVSIQPKGMATYTISRGQPSPFMPQVCGRIYPERLDDLTWENDRNAWRFYGPKMHGKGVTGFDLFCKNRPEPVQDKLYQSRYSITELDTVPDFVALANSYGIDSAIASDNEEAERIAAEMLKTKKPFVLVCNVHPNTSSI